MSNSLDVPMSPLHRLGVAGRVRSRVLVGSGASSGGGASGAPAARRSRTVALAFVFAALVLLALAPSAFAAGEAGVGKTIGGKGLTEEEVAAGLFKIPRAVAVNETGNGGVPAGTFYVVDSGNQRVQRFSPAGSFVSTWGWGVKNSAQEFQICTAAAECTNGTGPNSNNPGALGNSGAQGIAVDQSNGNVYVSDQVERRISVYGATGVFQGAFGWGVRNGAAEFQFCTTLTNCERGSSGAGAGQFAAAIGGVAVAPVGSPHAGDLYVANKTERRIDEFKPTIVGGIVTGVAFVRGFGWGAATGTTGATYQECTSTSTCHAPGGTGTNAGQFATNSPNDLAVDSEGNVFAVDNGNKRVQEFAPTGEPPTVLTDGFGAVALSKTFGTGEPLSIAVDPSPSPSPSHDHVLVLGKRQPVSNRGAVLELDHTGAEVHVDGTEITSETVNGLAVAQESLGSNIYVVSAKSQVLYGVYVLNPFLPTISAATGVTAHAAILHGEVFSEGQPVGYHFEYSTDGLTWTSVPSSDVTVPATAGKVAVEQEATGLVGSQTYFARLAQSRPSGGTAFVTASTSFTTLASEPSISATEARGIGYETATLTAQINPENQATGWHFEYLSEADWAANGHSFTGPHPPVSVPASVASAGESDISVLVSEAVSGLSPSTSYRFRLVASNPTGQSIGGEALFATYAAGEVLTGCPNEAFRIFAGAALPDCRAYEQASPVDKLGSRVGWGESTAVEAAADGDRVSFTDNSNLPVTGGGSSESPIFIASRSGGSWSTDGLVPPSQTGAQSEYFGWNEELSTSASFTKFSPAEDGLYLRDTTSGAEQLALPGEISGAPAGFAGNTSQLLFESQTALAAGAVNEQPNAYDLNKGTLTLAGMVPAKPGEETSCREGSATPCKPASSGSIAGPYAWFSESPSLTQGGPRSLYLAQSAISSDGSRIFFTEAGSTGGRLYVREDATTTVQVSAPNTGVTGEEKAAAFLQATPDGSRALFLSCQKLTADSTAVSTASARTCSNTSEQGQDLYLYDADAPEGQHLTDLTIDHTAGDTHGAQVIGFLGASRDGSHAYFVANGVLTGAEENVNHEKATAGSCHIGTATGECNLYLAQVGVGAQPSAVSVTFVARLAAAGSAKEKSSEDWTPRVQEEIYSHKSARVSADTGAVLFSSARQLTAYKNHEVLELYRYAPGNAGPTCISCNPTGAGPTGEALLQPWQVDGTIFFHRQLLPFLTRNISADGDRVFFQTPDKLVGADVNGERGCPLTGNGEGGTIPSCTDVYEWEAPGSGTCTVASPSYSGQDEGCLYLISSGTSSSPSFFGDADEEGENVFFFTEQPLVPQDTDDLIDVYDAHVGGGLASQQGSPPAPECTAEGCRGASSVAPSGQSPGSATFSGTGNLLVTAPVPAVKAKAKPLSRAQKLARALRACEKQPRRKRAACNRRARKRYGVAVKAKRSARNTNRRAR